MISRVLVTGSSGLIGSQAVAFYAEQGAEVAGVDNNMRAEFFGPDGDTTWNRRELQARYPEFRHHDLDIRDREGMARLFREFSPGLVVHCAAQPSHDLAKARPFDDFDVNAGGTLNLLECTRRYSPDAVFVFASTNKVYGDVPNELPLVELESRFDYALPEHREGIDELCRIDRCLHSLFGASKVAADVLVQEYGRNFGMKTGVFRGGCLTGPGHSGVQLHGFLNYLIRVAKRGGVYTIIGYKGKQVRDQVHSEDVVRAFDAFARAPRPGEVYNLGGGRANSISVLEAIERVQELTGRRFDTQYVDTPRTGDHIVYISDLRKLRTHYPEWSITISLDRILRDTLEAV